MLKLYKSDSKSSARFMVESDRLAGVLGCSCAIEHVGSTAIPNLGGKGIIDILVGFDSESQIEKAVGKLLDNGYYSSRKKNAKTDYVFLASSEDDTTIGDFHLHLALKNSKKFTDFIKIRDYLQHNPKIAKEYGELKQELAKSTESDRDEYKKRKSYFIENILNKNNNIDK